MGRQLRILIPGAVYHVTSFYLYYHDKPKFAPLVQEISWSKNIVIMESCNNDDERVFYISMTKNVLIHQIEGNSYWEKREEGARPHL
jgi:predicted nuclease of restriction endonuclease-like (RecB) superfamily